MHIAGKIAAGIAVFLTAATIVLLLSADAVLNGPVKERILRAAAGTEGTSLSLGDFHYSIAANRITCDSLRLSFETGHPASGTRLEAGSFSCSNVNWLRALLGGGFSCGDLTLQGLQGIVEFRDDPRKAGGDERVEEEEGAPLPAFLLPLSVGRLQMEGGSLTSKTHSRHGTWNDSIASVWVEVSDLRFDPKGSEPGLEADGMEFQARDGSFRLPGSLYRVTFASAQASGEDASNVRVDSLAISPVVTDKDLFAASPLRATSFRARMARLDIGGADLEGMLRGERYVAGMVQMLRPSFRIIVDMRKEPDPGTVEMPNEILTGMRELLRIDSLLLSRGTIEYGEVYPYSATPALLRWTDVHLSAGKISNRTSGTNAPPVRIETAAMFQDTARMTVTMLLPLAQQEFSFVCHGMLTSLPLMSLNSFLEVAEQTRVVSGHADSIGFALDVEDGRATGRVHPFYRDLKIEVLAEQTGRNDGIVQRLSTLIANTFKIKQGNMPGTDKEAGPGLIQYVRKPDDPFFKVVWFSLRGGLGSVVGF